MNDYNLIADYLAHKYIDRISGKDLGDRIVGENPADRVMTGLLAEDRVEQTFEGNYKENEETRFQSIPSISLKFTIERNAGSKITIYPKGLLFYSVKPTYAEVVKFFLDLESEKNNERYNSITEIADAFPDKKVSLPVVYKKVDIKSLFEDGIEVQLDSIDSEGVHLKDKIDETLRKYAKSIQGDIAIMNEISFSYADLINEDMFPLVCAAKDERVMPAWSIDVVASVSNSDDDQNVFVQLVNRTEKLNGNNRGYLPQIYDAGLDIVGDSETKFKEISLDYFKNNYKDRKKCYSIAENASSEFVASENMISTVNVPVYYQFRTITNDDLNEYIEFQKLIDDPIGNLEVIHKKMLKDYESCQKEFDSCKDDLSYHARDKYEIALEEYYQEINRFGNGIEQIKYKDLVFKAFSLMNKTFSTKVQGETRVYKGWRLFQIVFIVSLICEVIESEYPEDESVKKINQVETANLLYFPTGGGKTEAFLGISVFNMFFDRLRGKNEGVTGILKYPLRLLAVQQLDRVLSIAMKANLVREGDANLKETTPFAVGFLIGSGNTPNKIYENDMFGGGSEAIINGDTDTLNDSYRFIDTCPICRKKMVNVHFDADTWRLKHVCENPECSVNDLPLMIIDNEIYRYLPSLVVSTVDKMAALGFADEFKMLMGQVRCKCSKHGFSWTNKCAAKFSCKENLEEIQPLKDPIPTLMIQDEMHLVKESLGTFDAHYESFLKYYAEKLVPEEQRKHIRFIGATATISMYEEHIKHLYHMRGRRFPCEYPSRKAGKNFYSYTDENDITRVILGFAPYGRSIHAGMWESVYNMRLIVCDLMKNPQKTYDDLKKVGYKGSLEDLENALYDYWIELVYNNRKDDVMNLDNAFSNMANDRLQAKGLPLFVSSQMTSDTNFQEVRKTLFDIQSNRKNVKSTNLILATSTISHGVDEESFNNMFFYGMPNTNAEYIQAYSRTGRKYTGIVVDIIRLLRVRDRAYLKNFVLFHENRDDLVESVPINRWAKNAIYNTLPGLLNGLILQYYPVKLGLDSLNKTNALKKCLVDETITIADVVEKMIGIYGCSQIEKLSLNYEEIIKKEVYDILTQIKNGFFDDNDTTRKTIKSVYRKHFEPMTSLRDTEETIEVSMMER